MSVQAMRLDGSNLSPEQASLQSYRSELNQYIAREGCKDETMRDRLKELGARHELTAEEVQSLQLFLYRFRYARVVNAVCPFFTSQAIDRRTLYQNARRNNLAAKIHAKFTGVCIKYGVQEDSFTAIYFPSGAINCVGVKCLETRGIDYVEGVLRQHAPLLLGQEAARRCVYKTRRISNRVMALKVPRTIVLDRLDLFLDSDYWRDCKYVSQIFPGLIYRVQGCKAKVLYFTTGSMICCGITSHHLQERIGYDLAEKLAGYIKKKREKENQ